MIGLCLSIALVPLLSELIEILESKQIYDRDQISDVTASIFNAMFNLGNLIAPLIAGVMNDWVGYRSTTDFMMVTAFLFTILFAMTMFKSKVL